MKIFVSHSSKDKWAARRIAKDIEELGHGVFLDEKDISTGESIDQAVRENLKSCDHFLLLLSPASRKSEWVLVELGGAIALDKRIVPILLYLGANDVPQAINLKLARDINDISQYYDELGGLPTPPKAAENIPPSKPTVRRGHQLLKEGDIVRVARKTPRRVYRPGRIDNEWSEELDPYFQAVGEVLHVDSDGDCALDVDGGNLVWASEWLDVIKTNVINIHEATVGDGDGLSADGERG